MKWQDEPPTEECQDCIHLKIWTRKLIGGGVEVWYKCFRQNPKIDVDDDHCRSQEIEDVYR